MPRTWQYRGGGSLERKKLTSGCIVVAMINKTLRTVPFAGDPMLRFITHVLTVITHLHSLII